MPGIRRTLLAGACHAALAAATIACARPPEAVPPLALVPQAVLRPARVPAGGPVSLEYRFTVGASSLSVSGPFRVFVHFLDRHGALLFSFDHAPAPPVAEWQPGRTYAERRTIVTPEFPYTGPVSVLMGLYSEQTGERLPLAGRDAGQRRYLAGSLVLLPRDRELSLRCEGLYPPETNVAAPLAVARFMRREAVCRLANPREDVLVFVEGDLEPSAFATPPSLMLSVSAAWARHTLALDGGRQGITFRVPGRALGRDETAALRLETSAAYVPSRLGGSDPRELSLRLFHLVARRASSLEPALQEGAIPLEPRG